MNYSLLVVFLVLILLMMRKKRRAAAIAVHHKRNKSEEKKNMRELAQQFIGKECLIYTITSDFGAMQGIIKEVSDNGLLIENKGNFEVINLEYVSRIRECPRKKNGKKKVVIFD